MSKSNGSDPVSRREFLGGAAAGAAFGAGGLPRVFAEAAAPKPPSRSKVVEVTNPAWQQGRRVIGTVHCEESLGGLLKSYRRDAA